MSKKKITELLKIYSENLELLTPEECARLHQYASDQEKLGKEVKKVMTDMLLNVHQVFPTTINMRKAVIVDGSERAPSNITWDEIHENELPITKEVFLTCAGLNMTALKENFPAKAAVFEKTSWYQSNKTITSAYIKWSKPVKKIVK